MLTRQSTRNTMRHEQDRTFQNETATIENGDNSRHSEAEIFPSENITNTTTTVRNNHQDGTANSIGHNSRQASPRDVQDARKALLCRKRMLELQIQRNRLEQQLAEVDLQLAEAVTRKDASLMAADVDLQVEPHEDTVIPSGDDWPHHAEDHVNVTYHKNKSYEVLSDQLGAFASDSSVKYTPEAKLSEVEKLAKMIADLTTRNKPRVRFDFEFTGKSSEWLVFKKNFKETSEINGYSKQEDLIRLHSLLKGEALEAVASMLVSCADPDDVLLTLERRFANPEQIVSDQVNAIRSLPRLSGNSTKDLAIFANKIHNSLCTLRLMNRNEHILNPELHTVVMSKLTPLLRSLFVKFAAENVSSGEPPLALLSRFLNTEVDNHLKFGGVVTQTTTTTTQNPHRYFPPKVHHSVTIATPKKCVCCSDNHDVFKCPKFLSFSFDNRWQIASENHLCFKCLKKRHKYTCKGFCGVNGCKSSHNKLLHKTYSEQIQAMVTDGFQGSATLGKLQNKTELMDTNVENSVKFLKQGIHLTPDFIHAASALDSYNKVLLKVIAVTLIGPKGFLNTFALLDEGSTATLVDAGVASRLGINGYNENVSIDAIGGLTLKDINIKRVNFKIKGYNSQSIHDVNRAIMIDNLSLNSQTFDVNLFKSYPHLQDLSEYLCVNSGTPTLLLGQSDWPLIVSWEIRQGKPSEPVASRTALGWVAHGTYYSVSRPNIFSLQCHQVSTKSCLCDTELEMIIKNQYALDSIGISNKILRSTEDERALKILKETTRRLPNGQFEAGLLWRSNITQLPNSYELAFSRLRSVEKQMDKNSNFAIRYITEIQNMVSKNYASKCSKGKEILKGERRWYLPHFGVVNPNKPEKLRIVHDAKAKVRGVSLNSSLLTGPDLIQPLIAILMRFREGKYAFSGDIREMFPQVKVREADRNAQRFLWRGMDRDRTPDQYQMTSMIFGAVSSPCTAIYIKNLNAKEHSEKYPEACEIIINETYVDDCLFSLDDEQIAARLVGDVTTVNQFGHFEVRGWMSNSLVALSVIPEERRSTASVHNLSPEVTAVQRTLGLLWFPKDDTIGFNINLTRIPKDICSGDQIPTKRLLLSIVMSIYDPLGILGPFIIQGRILFQDVWRSNITWDERIKPLSHSKWFSWLSQFRTLESFRIPRCYQTKLYPISRQIHIFCDAGESAYGAVCYWRFAFADGSISVSLIASKARVAPLKSVSIPRLELQATLLGSRLSNYIQQEVKNKPDKIFYWSDSTTVLCWLKSDHRNYKTFVAHRVAEITDLTAITDWNWVPSELNSADLLTKNNPYNLNLDSSWFRGPDFLYRGEEEWPQVPPSFPQATDTEKRTIVNTTQQRSGLSLKPDIPDANRFSNWLRFLRATAVCYKFSRVLLFRVHSRKLIYSNRVCCDSNVDSVLPLLAEDLDFAKSIIWRRVQYDYFYEELKCLENQRPLSRSSKLFKLNIFLDEIGLIRMNSRIQNIEIDCKIIKRPLILHSKSPIVRLVILYYHVKYGHANHETVVNECRQVFWIIGLRSAVRSVAHNCQLCRVRRATPSVPPEGHLPPERLTHHQRAFTNVGLDYFGPMLTTVGRRKEKRWVALFTCLTSRAVHLELVNSLSSDSAIMALRRFIARRGCPSTIVSDNGTSFRGARNELQRARKELDTTTQQYTANLGIKWKFIPPASPFMGGSWERLIKDVKKTLNVILKERSPKEETLITLLYEVEGILNARPLTYISTDPDAPEALTPYHFLLGTASPSPQFGVYEPEDLFCHKEWRKAQRLADSFWNRWLKEYLPTLRAPHYGTSEHKPIKKGDLVLIVDPNLPRNTWPMGRVITVFPGADGIIRVVEVQTEAGTLKRAVKRVITLPIDGQQDGKNSPGHNINDQASKN